ncbi:MAG TPA: flagellar hook-basal body complex protein FliE [Caulobacteraceae bacterium]|jgi:flagellar hook-basal body complex protein FliE|nr:flagellar hook-basal body complex protein FliE [Caulobacteraceae bacterium]
MSGQLVEAIAPISSPAERSLHIAPQATPSKTSFLQMLTDGIDKVNEKANTADAAVQAFVLDDKMPPHRVFYALEQSSESIHMLMQVRNRVVDAYQDIMRTQL